MNTLVTELRIGNYILVDVGLPSLDLHQVKAEDFVGIAGNIHFIEPVPLTEEWLLKFGFIWSHYHQDTAQREYYGVNDFYVCKINGGFFYDNTKIEHVHQLQNLAFCLTQAELTLKH